MAFPTYTYVFTNGSTADATQVNQNFSDILNGISDTTRDISVNNITGSSTGTSTLSGNVVLGVSSSKTVTFNGSLNTSIPLSANNSYDIGGLLLGLRAVYFASSSSTNTVKITGPAISANVTLTLPTYTGTLANIPTVASSQTTTYAILTSDEFVPCSASGGNFTATLPTAAGVTGKIYRIKRTDQTLANTLTLATTSSQTIDGVTTRKLMTQYEQFTVISDGANWHILEHFYPAGWTSYTPTFSAGFGTVTAQGMFWRRVGDSMQIRGSFTTGTVANTIAKISLPSGVTFTGLSASNELVGYCTMGTLAGAGAISVISVNTDTANIQFGREDGTIAGLAPANVSGIFNAGVISFFATFPITNWEP